MKNCMKLMIWNNPPGVEPLNTLAAIEAIIAPTTNACAIAAATSTSEYLILVHTLGVSSVIKVHSQFSSTTHTALHPSCVSTLASSHCSPESLFPLAQSKKSTHEQISYHWAICILNLKCWRKQLDGFATRCAECSQQTCQYNSINPEC